MLIQIRTHQSAAEVRLTRTPLTGQEVKPLPEIVSRLMSDGIDCITFDLSEVRWLGAGPLGVLVAALAVVRRSGGSLWLMGVRPKVETILRQMRLQDVFQLADTPADTPCGSRQEALGALPVSIPSLLLPLADWRRRDPERKACAPVIVRRRVSCS